MGLLRLSITIFEKINYYIDSSYFEGNIFFDSQKFWHLSDSSNYFGLSIVAPPVIIEAPMSQKVKAGGTVAFICIATGDPSLNFTWRKDDKPIPQR